MTEKTVNLVKKSAKLANIPGKWQGKYDNFLTACNILIYTEKHQKMSKLHKKGDLCNFTN